MKSNLHNPILELVGRQDTMAALHERISKQPLVTICGPPGAGKTTLAYRVAWELTSRTEGELAAVWWVNLEAVSDAEGMLDAIAQILGVNLTFEADVPSKCAELEQAFVGRAPTLMCINEADRCVEPLRRLIAGVLRRDTHIAWLVTSRERLRVPGECVVRLGSLGEQDALMLLQRRLQESAVRTIPDAQLKALLEAIDCLPLVIELIASALELMTPDDVHRRWLQERSLGPLPTPEHRYSTLHEAIAWSWDHLDHNEQCLMACCAIFTGSFDVAAVEMFASVVGEDLLSVLQRLRQRSLIEVTPEGRLSLLTSIRNFARSNAPVPEQALAARFVTYFVQRAEAWFRTAFNAMSPEMLVAINADRHNLEQALAMALDAGEPERALWLLGALDFVLYNSGQFGWLLGSFARVLDTFSDINTVDAWLYEESLFTACRLARRVGNSERAQAWFTRLQALPGETHARRVRAALTKAFGHWLLSENAQAFATLAQFSDHDIDTLEPKYAGDFHGFSGMLQHEAGDSDSAEVSYRKAIGLSELAGACVSQAIAQANLGRLLLAALRFDEAEILLRMALETHRAFGIRRLESNVWLSLGEYYLKHGKHREAHDAYAQSHGVMAGTTNQGEEILGWMAQVYVHLDQGELSQAKLWMAKTVKNLHDTHRPRIQSTIRNCEGLCAWVDGDIEASIKAWRLALQSNDNAHSTLAYMLSQYLRLAYHQLGNSTTREDVDILCQPPPNINLEYEVTVDLLEAHIDLSMGLDALRRAWSPLHGASPFDSSHSVRLMVRTLVPDLPHNAVTALLAEVLDPEQKMLLVSSNAQRFRPPGGAWVDVGKKVQAQRFLHALTQAYANGNGLSVEQISGMLWPGENLVGSSGQQRVYQVVKALRRLGLGDLLTSNDGYRFAEHVRVVWLETYFRSIR